MCGVLVPAGQSRQLIVVKEKYQHPYRRDAFQKWVYNERSRRWRWGWVDDEGGVGERIVKEFAVCGACKASEQPTQVPTQNHTG
jgi:hypothetical protein